jgi:oleate hydratase
MRRRAYQAIVETVARYFHQIGYQFMTSRRRLAYLVGGGIGSLAAAAFLIRDAKFAGDCVTVCDTGQLVGGSLDATGSAEQGYVMRGGRMFTAENYECTWDLFKTIPSLSSACHSVYEETMGFNNVYKSHSMARLVDAHRARVPVTSMGFTMQDRIELLRLTRADELNLYDSCITDWLSPGFFKTNFWFMWATTFAFQPWHSAVEFRRYLHRFMLEFTRIETLAGVKRTTYNQYDSLVRPLQSWLASQGVKFATCSTVVALDHRYENGQFVVTGLHCDSPTEKRVISIEEEDLVFLQNGSMTDASSVGSMTAAPAMLTKANSVGWRLWERLAEGRPQFGNPEAFNGCISQSGWQSFTVTLTNSRFFARMHKFSGNEAGTGGLVTFKDSNWLMSVVLAHQPHFVDQPAAVQVFWGYGLFPDRIGNYVSKPMSECTGAEILRELHGHLRFDPEDSATQICIPCRMPYITSMFMPRKPGDRPPPVPEGCKNLAFVSQFVEIAEDVVFTVEYSIRAAQIAVYRLLSIDRPIPAITPHDASWLTQVEAVMKAFA